MKKHGFLYELKKNKVLFLMAMPSILLTFFLAYLPMSGLVLAFKNYRYDLGIFGSEWNGFANFAYLFQSGTGWLITRNTILYNLLNLITSQLLAVIVAIVISEMMGRLYKRIVQSVIFLPYFISWVIVGVMAFNIFSSDYGFINRLITMLGEEKISFYTTPQWWPFILIFFNIWKGVGYGSVMYLAAIMGIDTSVYEAAAIDGANVFQRIFKVTIPMIMPTMVILLLMSVGGIFKGNFDLFYNLVGNNGLLYNYTDVIDTLAMRALISSNDFGMSAAIGLFQSVLCLITVTIVNKLVSLYDRDYALF